MIRQLHDPAALTPGKKPLVLIGQGAGPRKEGEQQWNFKKYITMSFNFAFFT
jgi:hypothetical protein